MRSQSRPSTKQKKQSATLSVQPRADTGTYLDYYDQASIDTSRAMTGSVIKGELMKGMSESDIHKQVVEWLKLKHSNLIFISDASGLKLPIGQAVKYRQLQSERGLPDLFIAKPSGKFHGLFIELKTDESQVYKKDGGLRASEHIIEQNEVLTRLSVLGYWAEFGFGFNDTIEKIDRYLDFCD